MVCIFMLLHWCDERLGRWKQTWNHQHALHIRTSIPARPTQNDVVICVVNWLVVIFAFMFHFEELNGWTVVDVTFFSHFWSVNESMYSFMTKSMAYQSKDGTCSSDLSVFYPFVTKSVTEVYLGMHVRENERFSVI